MGRSARDAIWSRDGRRWLESWGLDDAWLRTVRDVPEDVEESEGEAVSGGERDDDAFEIRRDRAVEPSEGNGVAMSECERVEAPAAAAEGWLLLLLALSLEVPPAAFRSVCRLFWNQTVTDRSSLEERKQSWRREGISEIQGRADGDTGCRKRRRERDLHAGLSGDDFALLTGGMGALVVELLEGHELNACKPLASSPGSVIMGHVVEGYGRVYGGDA